MRKTLLLLTMLACGAGTTHIAAQTVVNASVESEYPTETGKNVRICVNPKDGATVIYYRDSILDTNCFIYHVPGASSDNKFVWPPIPEGTGFATCTVEDMKIIGDTLYFCGTADYPNGGVREKKGYVGWVRTSHLINPSGMVGFNYYSRFFDPFNTSILIVGLSHLDGYYNGGANTVNIGLVGKVRYTVTDTTSCLLLVKGTSGGWDYQFHYLTDTKETFTDIVLIENQKWLVVSSRFEHVYQDHYTFGIRYEAVNVAFGMYYTTLPQFRAINKFDTYNLNTSSSISQHPTWHRSDVEIHLVDDPSCAAYAIAAYECEDTAKLCENRQQTALFKLDFNTSPSPAISIAQLVYGYFRNPRTFVKIKNVLDDTTMVLLYRGLGDDGGMASTLLFPKWGHYGQIDGLLADYRYNTSIDIHKNRFIRLGGTSWIDKEVFHYNLDKRYIGSSCYSARPTFFSEKLQGQPSITYIHLVPIFIRTSAFIWIPFSMTRTSITKNSSCETNVYSK
ncbi:MAG: hypothetical protein IKH33_09335 [Bacteroidales bacterium]|nr:hypothetical protein [Bacteroidales bacterium]